MMSQRIEYLQALQDSPNTIVFIQTNIYGDDMRFKILKPEEATAVRLLELLGVCSIMPTRHAKNDNVYKKQKREYFNKKMWGDV
jgi:hypothetical protein